MVRDIPDSRIQPEAEGEGPEVARSDMALRDTVHTLAWAEGEPAPRTDTHMPVHHTAVEGHNHMVVDHMWASEAVEGEEAANRGPQPDEQTSC